MKKICFVLLTVLSAWLEAADFQLLRNGRAQAVFVMPENASGTLKKNIGWFNGEFRRCTGTVLPVSAAEAENLNRIIFDLAEKPLRETDAFCIDFPDSRTMRISGTERSVRWAFNHILEQEIGVRWLFPPFNGLYGPEINHYPQKKNIALKQSRFEDRPVVNLARTGDWKIEDFTANWNGTPVLSPVHTLTIDTFPVSKYAVDGSWPEQILPFLNGRKLVLPRIKSSELKNPRKAIRRFKSGWQPCWSEPDTVRIAVENILETLQKDPQKQIINLDVNDNAGYCVCEKCRAAVGGKRTSQGYPDYSELYWKWADQVVREVAQSYPDVLFSAIAYREVLTPPEFKLHKNLVPRLCIELVALNDPSIQALRMPLISAWAEKAEQLDLYDYMHGLDFFLLPRIYFHTHSRILKEMIRSRKLRSAYFESCGTVPFQGPQQELMLKLLWNPELDVEAFLKDWCEHAVGLKAAPYLMEYYRFWENYWTGPDIRKTSWYISVKNVYMQLGERNTHTYALKKGDMKTLRKLMEQTAANAETPEQKKRADILMRLFEFSENACIAAFSELIPPDGTLQNPEQALELLRQVPDALRAGQKCLKDPLVQVQPDKGAYLIQASLSSVGKVIPFLTDPRVREELKRLADNPALPFALKAQIRIWLGAKVENLVENGSLELEKPLPEPFWGRNHGRRDAERASDGRYSYITGNGFYKYHVKIDPKKSYLFLCDVFIAQGSGEGRFSCRIAPSSGTTPLQWLSLKNNILTGGVWNTYSMLIYGNSRMAKADNLQIQLWFQNFEKNEPVWFDNIRLYCLDEIH